MKSFFTSTFVQLALIASLAFWLRWWQVGTLPAQLNRDEAAIGYNAKLLAETGKDEWGKTWPLALESFGDYKLPGYIWLVVGAGKLFGWHDWVVRLPSVIAGSLLPLAVYAWLRAGKKTKELSLWAAVLVSLAPFSWFYSRMAFEANVALTLLVTWLALVAAKQQQLILKTKFWWTDLGLVVLVLAAILTYNTPLLLLPFLLVALPWVWDWQQWRRWLVVWLALAAVTVSGFYALAQLFGQKTAITLFSDQTIWAHFIDQRESLTGVARLFLGHWWSFLGWEITWRWLMSWSPGFVVQHGGTHPWHTMPGSGHLFWLTYVLGGLGLLTGLGQFFHSLRHKAKRPTDLTWYLYLTLISLAPAVITVDAPHATRSLLFFVLLTVWAAEGLAWLAQRWPTKKLFFLIVISGWLLIEAGWYGHRYFVAYAQNQAVFQPGVAKTVKDLARVAPTGPVAVVGDGYTYIVWAWYSQTSSAEFFSTVVKQLPDRIGFRYGERVGRYHFIAHPEDRSSAEPTLVQWKDESWQIQTF